MTDPINRLADYGLCSRCAHRRPRTKLQETAGKLVCSDRGLCDALLGRYPNDPSARFENLRTPPDWDRVPDPPLIQTTQFHRRRSGEIAAVTAYTNGKSDKGLP